MFKFVKGKLVSASCRAFEKFPSAKTQQRLEASGWKFHTIHGPGDDLLVIVHPDGQYIDGYGSPHYRSGDAKAYRQSRKKRWHDFALALADHPDAPRRKPKMIEATAETTAAPLPAVTAVAVAAEPPARASVSLVLQL
jgi:hypothetical protein